MKEYNLLLKKQLKKVYGNDDIGKELSPQVMQLLDIIDRTYIDYENDKKLLERSIDISSKEYIESIEKSNLLQAQLVSNEKMAGIGQLSAGIAHEINNPLGFVQSNMQILQKYITKLQKLYELNQVVVKEDIERDNLALLNDIQEFIRVNKLEFVFQDLTCIMDENRSGLQRIEKIVKSLLGFARTGNSEEYVEYDLNQGIKDTLVIANNEIKYNATVIEQLETIPQILAKDGEINQVLLNIIVNASHAIKGKGNFGTITIHTYSDDINVYCEISDDGMGISERYINRIFEPFFTTKPVGSGTGLGLSIAHDIVYNKHNGSIVVKSALGIGTTFKITLPIQRIKDVELDN